LHRTIRFVVRELEHGCVARVEVLRFRGLAGVGALEGRRADDAQRRRREAESELVAIGRDIVANEVVRPTEPETGALATWVSRAVTGVHRDSTRGSGAHREIMVEDVET